MGPPNAYEPVHSIRAHNLRRNHPLHVALPGIYLPVFSSLGDLTTNLLRHALAGALASFALALALFPEHAQAATFAGAMSALLVNMDRRELPQGRRTPFGHSLLAWMLWTYAAAVVMESLALSWLMDYAAVAPVALGFAMGYATHLALDAFGAEGIYLLPNRRFPALDSLPEGCSRQWEGWSVLRLNRGFPRDVPARL